jgi:iron uptake system component EfeO
VTVKATDTGCELSTTEGKAGTTTFAITNGGSMVTEVYIYSGDGRVLSEAENIPPGLQRQISVPLTEAGRYEVACKPGMVGDGIRAAYTVAG